MVERATVTLRSASARQVIDQLEQLRSPSGEALIAFDADGTLWSGDVSEDVFAAALDQNLIRPEASLALAATAASFGIDSDGTVSQLAARVFAAYRAGRYPEREVCEMMTWCYAGWTAAELRSFARQALERANIGSRLQRQLEPIVEWARGAGVRTTVISASPRCIVEVAASLWQFEPSDIAASNPAYDGEVIAPRMDGEVPYQEAKCRAGERLLQGADWLASFGDNIYDIEMMQRARLGVAVEPKPRLRKLLPELPSVVLLV